MVVSSDKSECLVAENAENPGITENHSGVVTLNVFLSLCLKEWREDSVVVDDLSD